MSPSREICDPFRALQAATRVHRRAHGCEAYTFEDGVGLTALSAKYLPSRILELGTALGYTACCLASGSPHAHVDTIERDPAHVALAVENIAAANLSGRVTVHAGDFEEIVPTLHDKYELAFVDGLAPSPSILKALQTYVSPGGVLVCANLSLASASEAQRINQLFIEASVWRRLPSIESGATSVWLKI
jgi:predicted O-methyltransferase YrrM